MTIKFYCVEKSGLIAMGWLNRPEKKNAMGKVAGNIF